MEKLHSYCSYIVMYNVCLHLINFMFFFLTISLILAKSVDGAFFIYTVHAMSVCKAYLYSTWNVFHQICNSLFELFLWLFPFNRKCKSIKFGLVFNFFRWTSNELNASLLRLLKFNGSTYILLKPFEFSKIRAPYYYNSYQSLCYKLLFWIYVCTIFSECL